jgi:hypothetical protein
MYANSDNCQAKQWLNRDAKLLSVMKAPVAQSQIHGYSGWGGQAATGENGNSEYLA